MMMVVLLLMMVVMLMVVVLMNMTTTTTTISILGRFPYSLSKCIGWSFHSIMLRASCLTFT